ncbi:vomeronasal type-1 receptor 1-like [Equus caballus]|uniref:vomeronasal type-1 receptor 1-like n=1 Tax=Equus caballus TaxID=9796 RepID=UPI000155EF70|nr:vomeronasal type-1 receptor 1-like [Equus caballus]XP_008525383.1 PREDICTED: vomeronasal type-1 receptor 1-like [Equus przewalskii]
MSFQKDVLRTTGVLAVTTTFLLQIVVGTLFNVILFFDNITPILLGHRKRPTQIILTHMAVANLLFLLSTGITHIKAGFILRNPLSSVGCKFVYYIHRVARSSTLCCTCVLSTHQSFTLIPGRVAWMMPRGRSPKVIGPSCSICWMFSFLMNCYIPMIIYGAQDVGNDTDFQEKLFCSLNSSERIAILWSISDVMFIGLMGWASGSMALFLHRHHQRVQHIHTSNGNHKCPPETRATHTILMLVVTFIFTYIMNSGFVFYMTIFFDTHLWLMQISNILALSFPTFSPLVLILRHHRALSFC